MKNAVLNTYKTNSNSCKHLFIAIYTEFAFIIYLFTEAENYLVELKKKGWKSHNYF